MADNPTVNVDAFRAFEHRAWERSARPYHHFWTRLTLQAVEPLLSAVGIHEGMDLLDVATGQGNVAQAAAARGARVVGLDLSAAMLAEARQRHPHVDFCEGDAEALPFPDSRFDVVVINFGLLHFGSPERALTEAYRVLRHGGRVGLTVWARPEAAVGFHIMLEAIRTHGTPDVRLPEGPPFFRFSHPVESQRTLLDIGFIASEVSTIPQRWRLDSADDLFVAFYEGTARTGGLLRAQSSEALNAIRAAVRSAAQVYEKDGLLEIPMPALLASAVKP